MRKLTTFLFFGLVLTGCNLPTSPSLAAAPTVDVGLVGTIAVQTLEALATPTPAVTATPPATATPVTTSTPSPSLTPTYELPMLHFDDNINCRTGPGAVYQVVTVVRSGQTTEIVGRAEQGNYWLIKNPNGEGTCWIAGDFAQVSGSVHLLPALTAPPAPTAAPPLAPTWQSWSYSCSFAPGGSEATVQLVWADHSQDEDGYNVYRNEQVIVSFGPNTTAYTDVAFVAAGQSLNYAIEVYSAAGRARSSLITITCQ